MFLSNGSSIRRPHSIAEIRIIVGGGLIPPYNQESTSDSTEKSPPSQFGLSWYWDTLSDGRRYIGHGGSVPGIVNLINNLNFDGGGLRRFSARRRSANEA
ncbi:unnamed protein product [Rotaria sordida]|uniref:Uncharacterized protein n=1 Tax=Rotaria sordida TaxID=392033 RepID=A0A814RWZ1_9BILA|nr:unnamed protein product [Rotaria sordida]CAF3616205.1 unnamed protein product [Rotaria sordida]